MRLPGCPLVSVPACTVILTDPLFDMTGSITVRLRKSTSTIWSSAVVAPRLTIWLPGEVVPLFSRTFPAAAFALSRLAASKPVGLLPAVVPVCR